jgi:tripeptidyl-peptidase-1
MRFSRIAILGVSPFGVLALPTTDSRFVHESVAKLPNGWTFNGQAEDSLSVRLSLALKQSRLSELKARLEVTSDPSHPDYGAHLTRDLLKKFQEPDQEGIAAVESWLQKNGIQFALEDSWIRFNTTVGEANRLLDAEFGRYQHMSDSPVLRSKQYSLPSDVADYVDFAYPVTQFMSRPAKRELSPPEMVKRQEAGKYSNPAHILNSTDLLKFLRAVKM